LIRAVGVEAFIELLDSRGDLPSFRSMQRQPAWRGRQPAAQLRRYLGAGSRRKLRYARLLVQSIDLARVPRSLDGVLASV